MTVMFELRCPISADLTLIRDLVRICAERGGLTGERLDDLIMAVNEAVTNVLDHGGQAGLVTVSSHADGITVEVLDTAGLLTVGHLAAARVVPTARSGFGLWVIQHLCDRVGLEQTGLGSRLILHMSTKPAPVIPLTRRDRQDRQDGQKPQAAC